MRNEIVGTVLEKWQRIDVLVNNAGITKDRSLQKMTDEDWEQVIAVNLNGTFNTTSAALPAMINQRFGRIINISSVVGQAGAFGQANYSASKGGITAFTKTIALESAKYNITANTIAPGYTATEMVQEIPEKIASQIRARIPARTFCYSQGGGKSCWIPGCGRGLHHGPGIERKRRMPHVGFCDERIGRPSWPPNFLPIRKPPLSSNRRANPFSTYSGCVYTSQPWKNFHSTVPISDCNASI